MSGGKFKFNQHRIREIYEDVEEKLANMGKEMKDEDLWFDEEYYTNFPNEMCYETYPKDVVDELKNAIEVLKKAYIYAQRVDWFLSGDDGEESFIRRLAEDFEKANLRKPSDDFEVLFNYHKFICNGDDDLQVTDFVNEYLFKNEKEL